MARSGIRFLSKILRNLPADFLQQKEPERQVSSKTVPLVKESSLAPKFEDRLEKIEQLLERLVNQVRVKEVFRDEDDLVVKILDKPYEVK